MRPCRPEAAGPLDRLRVLDLSRLVAGNMLSLQLADFGAEVINIADPRKGDPLRDWRTNNISVHWKVYARNKKSVTLNLRDPQGLDLLRKLVATAQVFIENFRPGTLEDMGIGPDALLAINPKLIVVRVSGWGQDGPYRLKPGFGSLVEGMSGFASKNGFADRPPVLPPLALADMIASLYASIQSMAERLYRTIGRADMIDDPRFRTNTDRVKNIDEADLPVAEFIKARTLAESLAVFEAAEVTAAPVYDIDQFIADPHVQARQIVTDLPDPEMGSVPMHAVVPRLSGTPGEIRNPAPALGEHNDAILGSLGLDAAALNDLRQRKVI